VIDETGTPAGWFPLLRDYDNLPPLDPEFSIPAEIAAAFADQLRQTRHADELAELKRRLRTLYEAGPGATVEEDEGDSASSNVDDDDDSETVAVGARLPLPAETFLEELSQKLELHPISVYWLLKEGIEKEDWRCLPEERRLSADRITVTVLRLLGHRWPKQIEAAEPVPDWAEADGLIPLTPLANESMQFERVLERMKVEGGRRNNEESDSSFILHPSSFILHPSSFILHPSTK
jgi:hypothetical protein